MNFSKYVLLCDANGSPAHTTAMFTGRYQDTGEDQVDHEPHTVNKDLQKMGSSGMKQRWQLSNSVGVSPKHESRSRWRSFVAIDVGNYSACACVVVASFLTLISETSSRTTSCWVNMRSRLQCRSTPYQSSWPREIWWLVHRLVSDWAILALM